MTPKTPLLIGIPGFTLSVEDETRLCNISPSGIILFSRNYKNTKQIKQLIQSIHSLLGEDTIIAVDHEGGRVVRFPTGLPGLPSPRVLGEERNYAKVHKLCRDTGDALRDLGITLNLAPVVDVETSETHRKMRDRCFGSDPTLVADMSTAFIQGMHEAGLQCTAKHFPGLGPGKQDTHKLRTTISLDQDTRKSHWHPFRQAIAANVDAILVSHANYPELDPNYPATLSQKVITKLLREKFAFPGLIISDDMDMDAILAHHSIESAVNTCLNAGCDLVSVCHELNHQMRAYHSIANRMPK